MLSQISVFVENKKGRLASVVEILEMNKIDVRALSIADSDDFGIVRMIVKDAEKVVQDITDKYIKNIDSVTSKKEKEIMEI